MKNLDLLIPREKPVTDWWTWATVTEVVPLQIRLDGETTPLDIAPENLAGPLAIGDRVWVQVSGRRLLIVGASNGAIPAGSMQMFAGSNTPGGWLACDGQAVSRTTYARLFAAIGTTYGSGDGSTTFNVPDMRDRSPRGADASHAVGDMAGSDSITLSTSQLPSHDHSINHDHANATAASAGAHSHSYGLTGSGGADGNYIQRGGSEGEVNFYTSVGMNSNGSHTHSVNIPSYSGRSGNTGSGNAINVRNPTLTVGFIIKF